MRSLKNTYLLVKSLQMNLNGTFNVECHYDIHRKLKIGLTKFQSYCVNDL